MIYRIYELIKIHVSVVSMLFVILVTRSISAVSNFKFAHSVLDIVPILNKDNYFKKKILSEVCYFLLQNLANVHSLFEMEN
jgi:hypothetical protein